MTLTWLDWTVLVAYFGCLTAMGWKLGRGQHSRDDYQLGGRRIHWALAGGSLLATLLSTLTFLSLPGEMIRNGPTLFASVLALPLAAPVVGRVLIPVFKAMPYASAYEYLEGRFGKGVQRWAALVFVARTLIWMGLIVYTCCLVVTTISGWSLSATILAVGITTTMYSAAGGFRTVVYTDNLQLVILLGGAIAIPVAVSWLGPGPLEWVSALREAGHGQVKLFRWDPTVRLTLVGVVAAKFFWTICTHGSDQVAVQRYLSTPTEKTARRSLYTAMAAEAVLLGLLMVCGAALFALYQSRSGLEPAAFLASAGDTADQLLPRFIVEELPGGVSGLILAAMLAAAMSSLSSGVNSVSAVFVQDLRLRRSEVWEPASLRLDRIVALAAGLASTGVALGIAPTAAYTNWNLVDLIDRLNHIFVGPLAVLFFAGILFKKASAAAALVGFGAALTASLLICMPGSWLGIERDISFMWIVAVPFVLGLAVAFVFSTAVRALR